MPSSPAPPAPLVFARTPQFLPGFFSGVPRPPVLAQLGGQCGAWAGAPDRDAVARHTPGAFVRAARSRPLSEEGTACVWGSVGVLLARPGCCRARAGQCTRQRRRGRPMRQGRWPPPGLLNQLPQAKAGEGGKMGARVPQRRRDAAQG